MGVSDGSSIHADDLVELLDTGALIASTRVCFLEQKVVVEDVATEFAGDQIFGEHNHL